MRYRLSPSTQARPSRSAFTLVELLMVIAIIAILVALLVPALASMFGTVKDAQVASEITGLGNGCDEFKNTYQRYPPSSIVLYEQGGAWSPQSMAAIRAMWPEFDFSVNRDINNNGTPNEVLTLTGDECLVFFLGGLPQNTGGLFNMTGFSPNKANPFAPGGTNRVIFMKDWDAGRLTDRDGDGMPEYTDILNIGAGRPYLYVSTNNPSNAYRVADIAFSGMTSVYGQGTTPWKPGGFQIISAGADHAYGTGGQYTVDGAATQLVGPRGVERDNITNFSGGTLGQ